MDETKKRLIGCFGLVFPDLEESEIPSASQATVPAWDSVAAITLLNVLEDEYRVEIDFDVLPELDSFGRILAYLETRVPTA